MGFWKSRMHVCCEVYLHTGASAMHLSQRVSHSRFVSQEGSEVDGTAGVIFGPWTHPPSVLLASLVRQEAHVPVARSMEFAMRLKSHDKKKKKVQMHIYGI